MSAPAAGVYEPCLRQASGGQSFDANGATVLPPHPMLGTSIEDPRLLLQHKKSPE